MSKDHVAGELEQFIRKRFKISARDRQFTREANLWEEGYVDSLSGVELVHFLEAKFAIRMPDDVFHNVANASINGLATTVSTLLPR